MRRFVAACSVLLLVSWASTATGELHEAFMDPMRGRMDSLVLPDTEAAQQRSRTPHAVLSNFYPARPDDSPVGDVAVQGATSTVVKVVASTMKGLLCKPAVCAYDSQRRGRGPQLRGDAAWSTTAFVNAGVFSSNDVDHYLHLIKVCHSIKGAYAAESVKGAYNPETGRVDIVLRYPTAEAHAASGIVGRAAAVSKRVSAMLADSIILQGAMVKVSEVTVHSPQKASL